MKGLQGTIAAEWREAGQWWAGDPYREVVEFVTPTGKVETAVREAPCVGNALLNAKKQPFVENHAEDPDMRFAKERDQKVAQAMGLIKPHGYRRFVAGEVPGYALLHACSGYAIGRGAMLAAEIPVVCAARSVPIALLADPFSLAGAHEFTKSAKGVGIKPLIGASFELAEGGEIVLVARSVAGWRSLSRLITECHLDEPRQYPLATWERLARHRDGLLCLTGGEGGPLARMLPRGDWPRAQAFLGRLIDLYGRDFTFVQIERSYLPWTLRVGKLLVELAEHCRVRAVAGGLVTHEERGHFPAQDLLACIHTLCGIEDIAGRKPSRHANQPRVPEFPPRALNAERFVRSAGSMARLFRDEPDLLANTLLVADLCEASVLPPPTELPRLCDDESAELRARAWVGARERYGPLGGMRELERRIERELNTIDRLGFSAHFLIAAQMTDWARERGIVMAGRGSVEDSVIAYCLGISRVDALRHNLAFERFLPSDGNKKPDIDIDFERGRREEVRLHLIERSGDEHVASVCAYSTYRTRGIIRGVGKVLGIPPESIDYLTDKLHASVSPEAIESALEKRPELRSANIPRERFRWAFAVGERLKDIPRMIQTHPSGIVVSRDPIRDVVPVMQSAVESVRFTQFDKYSVKVWFNKYDALRLGALDILAHAQRSIRRRDASFDERTIPIDDPATFRTLRAGDTIGITQSASPAMTAAHVRVRTDSLEDAALVQACIRPGVGGCIKNELLVDRRFGAPFAFEHPDMEPILSRTYEVVVFQEQVDELLMRFAGYTEGEAEEIREGIYKLRRENYVEMMREEITRRIVARYRNPALADVIYDLVAPYQGYGFSEGHALAFAETTLRSMHTKINYPSEFFAAVLEAQPAGYYPASTISNEARNKGIKILPLSINASGLSYVTEDVMAEDDPRLIMPNGGIRLPLTRVLGVSLALARRTVEERERGAFASLAEYALRCRPADDELRALVTAGAFDELNPNRRAALWGVAEALEYGRTYGNREGALPIYVPPPVPPTDVDDFARAERALFERRLLGLDVAAHIMAFERARVAARGVMTMYEAGQVEDGALIVVVGNPLRLRYPPTKHKHQTMFFDAEDETGLRNFTCFHRAYQKWGNAIVNHPYNVIWARAQLRQGHMAYVVEKAIPYRPTFAGEPVRSAPFPLKTGDFLHC